MAKSLRPIVKKLQTALFLQRGRRISITHYQMYSDKAQRTVTKYVVSENTIGDAGENNYHTLFSTWSMPEVVKRLADMLNEGNEPNNA